MPNRAALTGILFVLKTGLPWEYLPAEMGCGSGMTCWRRLRDWQQAGVQAALHRALLERLEGAGQLDWSRAALDSTSVPAKRGNLQRGQPPRQHDACSHVGRDPASVFGEAGPPTAASPQAARWLGLRLPALPG